MKITFINEIADLCEKVGADVQEVFDQEPGPNGSGVVIPRVFTPPAPI